jgi:hypothetical protein
MLIVILPHLGSHYLKTGKSGTEKAETMSVIAIMIDFICLF